MQDENKNNTLWPLADPIQTTSPFEENNNSNGDLQEKMSELEGINKEAMREILSGDSGDENDSLFNDNTPPIAEIMPEEDQSDFKPTENLFNQDSDNDLETESVEETVVINKRKFNLIQKLIRNIEENTKRVNELLASNLSENDERITISDLINKNNEVEEIEEEGNVIEGVFNGQFMIGPDGKQYNVPVNYASKSKLVEGDILKLTIASNGKFIYKQIGPIERERITGRLVKETNDFFVHSDDNRKWKILTASVTYFKGNLDDEVIILVPKHGESNWAAVENIVNQG